MTRRIMILLGALGGVGLLAFAMQGVVERMVLRPLMYLWWIGVIYYHAVPQLLWWILIAAFALWLILGTLMPGQKLRPRKADPPIFGRGQVESLALWLTKVQRGSYFKWLVAQRLGKLARDLIAFQTRRDPPSARDALRSVYWNPPEDVVAYLESGLTGSFADYPQPRWPFESATATPLDLNPQEALDFIESNLEKF